MNNDRERPIDYREHEDGEQIQACSAMDCTGLIPSLPESEAQLEHYEEMYPYIAKAHADRDTSR